MSILPSQQPNKGFLGIVGVPILLGVWALASYSGAVNPLVLPPPSRVFLSVLDIGFPIVLHIGATTARIVLGFALATLLGCAVGLLMQYSRVCFSLIDGLIETSRPVPPVALVPFFILIFGFSETGRLLLVVIGASLIITVTVVEAIARVPPGLIRAGFIMTQTRFDLFTLVLIPAAVPGTRAGFRIALALSITLVVVSEFLGSQYGLGYLISVSKVTLTTSTMLLCILLLGLIGYILDLSLRLFFNYVTRREYTAREVLR